LMVVWTFGPFRFPASSIHKSENVVLTNKCIKDLMHGQKKSSFYGPFYWSNYTYIYVMPQLGIT
jgi:hypothetical protein